MIVSKSDFEGAAVGHHYNELDVFYREIWGEHVHHGLFERGSESVEEATEALVKKVATAAHIESGSRVCDVGCGYGATARWLAEDIGANVTGLTLSKAQADYSLQQPISDGAPSPKILVSDWLDNDLPDDHFDAVVAIESTTHMPERERVFSEMARVLRPGGRLATCVWMTDEAPSRSSVKYLLEPICREGKLAGMGSAAENIKWIEAAGFTEVVVEDLSGQVARTWTICARRVVSTLFRDKRYRHFLFDATSRDRGFVRTLFRLRLAYAIGAMKYGFIEARKPI